MATRKMHQTTVRFGGDLWEALEHECARLGVSVAQYVREAALTRLVYAAGRRGDDEFELALDVATGGRRVALQEAEDLETVGAPQSTAATAHEHAQHETSAAAAVAAQSRLARRRARELRELVARRRKG